MKILYVTHNWHTNPRTDAHHFSEYTGYGRLVYYMAEKHDVTLLTWGDTNNKNQYKNINIITRKINKSGLFPIRSQLSEYAATIAEDYDVIHSLYSDTASKLIDHENLVVTFHVLPRITEYNNIKSKIFIWLKYFLIQRVILQKCKNIISIASNLQKKYPNFNFNLIRHGVDVNYWQISEKSVSINLDPEKRFPRKVLCVGYHAIAQKDLLEVIDSMPNVLFILVGKKIFAKRTNILSKNNISDEVLRELYKVSDVFFRPLLFSTANNSILEAMSMELPIVTNKIPGVTDYLDNFSAVLVDSNDEYTDKLRYILENREKANFISANARKKVVSELSWEVISKKIEGFYSKVKF